jgi:uncharacterized membrane protein
MKEHDLHDTGFFRRLRDSARERRPRGVLSRLRNRLVVGLLVAFPLVVTVLFARFMFELLDRWFRPIAKQLFGFPVPGAGAVLSLLGLYLLGILATNVFGTRILHLFERLVANIPLLSPIYKGARQITEAVQVREIDQFRRVVLLPFPHQATWSLGFVTREFPAPSGFSSEASCLVFVPTTPNPTSGFLVSVRVSDLRTLPISVEEGVKLVISGGLLVPRSIAGAPPAAAGGQTKAGDEPRPPDSTVSRP